MLRFFIIRVAGHPQLCPSLPFCLKLAALCPARFNRSHHSTHASLVRSTFRFVAFRSLNLTSDVSRILIPRLASSTTCNLRLLRNQIVVARIVVFSRVASLAKVLAATGPVVQSGSVCSRLGNEYRTPQRPHSVAGYRSRIGETRHQ